MFNNACMFTRNVCQFHGVMTVNADSFTVNIKAYNFGNFNNFLLVGIDKFELNVHFNVK